MQEIGYFLLFIYSFGGGFIGLATAAAIAATGKLSLVLSIGIATAANFIGSTLLFFFARHSKAEVGNYLKKHRRKLAFAHLLMKKQGSFVLFAHKFIYGVKTIVPLAAGVTRYDAFKFVVLNIAASSFWAASIGFGGYFFGGAILRAANIFEEFYWIAPLVLVLIVLAIYLYLNKITKKEKKYD